MRKGRISRLLAGLLALSLAGIVVLAVVEKGMTATHPRHTSVSHGRRISADHHAQTHAAPGNTDAITLGKSDLSPQVKAAPTDPAKPVLADQTNSNPIDQPKPNPANQAKPQESRSSDLDKPLVSYLQNVASCPAQTPEEIAAAVKAIQAGQRTIPEAVNLHADAWLWYSHLFRYLNYGISMAVVFFGALAAALHDEDKWYKRWKTMAAILATVAAGANTTFQPYTDFKKFDDAWVVLNTMRTQYMTNARISVCDFSNAIAYGETIIHRGE